MRTADFSLIADLALDPGNGWSIGSFGAIAEFIRDRDEPVDIRRGADRLELVTGRGAMRIAPTGRLAGLAWDSLAPDGESWNHEMAFCVERPETAGGNVAAMGPDVDAIRPEDRNAMIYDLGVCHGAVALAVRSHDPMLNAALDGIAGRPLFDHPEVLRDIMRVQPHRIGLSAAGRIEVFQAIPQDDGSSPVGPHTHVLPKLIAAKQTHARTAPIPAAWQPALSMHPPSPWRDALGRPKPFDAEADRRFAPLLDRFGPEEDRDTEIEVRQFLAHGPELGAWPSGRRARLKARIMLRRLAAAGDERSAAWRSRYDVSARSPRQPAHAESE